MPEDITYCRKRVKFKEKDLLNWFRRFRNASPKGEMNQEELKTIFKEAFPLAEGDIFAEAVFEVFNDKPLDFKVRLKNSYIL